MTPHNDPPTPGAANSPRAPARSIAGHQVNALTEQIHEADTYDAAATVTEHVVDPSHGVLERLRQFFETAAAKARDSHTDLGQDLSLLYEDTATTLAALIGDLDTSEHQLRDLDSLPQPRWQARVAHYYSTAPHRPTTHACPTTDAPEAAAPQARPAQAPRPGHHR